MTKLPVPFNANPGNQCGQACAVMIIKYYFPNFIPDFRAINKLIHYKKNKYTFPLQNAIILDEFGLNCKCYTSDSQGYTSTDEDKGKFRRWFGKSYEYEKKYLDEAAYNWSVKL